MIKHIILLNLFIISFGVAKDKGPKEVFIANAKKSVLTQQATYPAVVKSRVYSQVATQFPAIVDEVLRPLGSKVKKGENILKISNQDKSLNYRSSYLKAPVSGVLSWIGVQVGNFISTQTPAFVITDPEKLFVTIEIPIKDISTIEINQTASLIIDGAESTLELTVVGRGSYVDKLTGTLTVELSIKEQSMQKIYPGQIAKATFEFKSKPVFLVKESAVKLIGEESFIQLIEDEKVKKVKVKLGKKSNGQSVITEGLIEDQIYIERASGHLVDGDKVKVVEKI